MKKIFGEDDFKDVKYVSRLNVEDRTVWNPLYGEVTEINRSEDNGVLTNLKKIGVLTTGAMSTKEHSDQIWITFTDLGRETANDLGIGDYLKDLDLG